MKIYTGSGDRGKTSLFSGERIAKSNDRIEAYGDVDELNSVLGYLASILKSDHDDIVAEIRNIQSHLFHVGAWLATTPDSPVVSSLETLPESAATVLEQAIDRMEDDLEALGGFILPGGHATSAIAHVARTVCRRAERHTVRILSEPATNGISDSIHPIIVYLNRLSDYLFVLARHCNHIHGVSDIPWKA